MSASIDAVRRSPTCGYESAGFCLRNGEAFSGTSDVKSTRYESVEVAQMCLAESVIAEILIGV
jgi:hypothetical protein